VAAIVTSLLTAVVTGLLFSLTSFGEPHLVYVGGDVPKPPVIDAKQQNGKYIFYIFYGKLISRFQNRGLRAGHIEKVDVSPVGLKQFPEVKVIYLDKRDLHFLQKRDIVTEFIIDFDQSKMSMFLGPFIEIKLTYYGKDGEELYWQGFRLYLKQR
jgi:hypothetical protein